MNWIFVLKKAYVQVKSHMSKLITGKTAHACPHNILTHGLNIIIIRQSVPLSSEEQYLLVLPPLLLQHTMDTLFQRFGPADEY